MRLFGLICWYDEAPSWLAACVASLAKVGVDHIIAVDGAYHIFPEGKARSSPEQAETIYRTADGAGMGCTIHAPQEVWMGNEVEKRSKMFEIAESISELNTDWWFVMDADQVVMDPEDWMLKPRLDAANLDVAETMFFEPMDPYETEKKAKVANQAHWDKVSQFPIRNLFRALPQLRLGTNHFTYRTADGRTLWGNPHTKGAEIEPALALHDVRIDHRTWFRDKARHDAQYVMYRRREELGIETGLCYFCGERASQQAAYDFNVHHIDGQPELVAGTWIDVCDACEPKRKQMNDARLRYLGYDPAGAEVTIRRVNVDTGQVVA